MKKTWRYYPHDKCLDGEIDIGMLSELLEPDAFSNGDQVRCDKCKATGSVSVGEDGVEINWKLKEDKDEFYKSQ